MTEARSPRKSRISCSDADRPQFLTVSVDDPEMLEPLVEEQKSETLYDKFYAFLRKLAQIARMIFDKLKGIID